MTTSLRIGHVTDLHLRRHLDGSSRVPARRSREAAALLGEAVAGLNAAGVDLVAVTGDLVDHPVDEPQTAAVRAAGTADLRLVGDALSGLDCPWVVLPGNHDDPGLFAEVFGHAEREVEVGGVRVVAFHDWDQDLGRGEAIPADVPRRAGGERDRFGALLADGDPRPQVHLQHYVITPRLDEGWPHTYVDGEALCGAVCADGRVRLCLSGHYHPGVEPIRVDAGDAGGTWFCVAPAFCQAPHPYLVHHLQGHDLTTRRVDLRPNLA